MSCSISTLPVYDEPDGKPKFREPTAGDHLHRCVGRTNCSILRVDVTGAHSCDVKFEYWDSSVAKCLASLIRQGWTVVFKPFVPPAPPKPISSDRGNDSSSSRRVYVGNVPRNTSVTDLISCLFNALGRYQLLSGPHVSAPFVSCTMNVGYAFVECQDTAVATACLSLDRIPLFDQALRIERPNSYRGPIAERENWKDLEARFRKASERRALSDVTLSANNSQNALAPSSPTVPDLEDDSEYDTDDAMDEVGRTNAGLPPPLPPVPTKRQKERPTKRRRRKDHRPWLAQCNQYCVDMLREHYENPDNDPPPTEAALERLERYTGEGGIIAQIRTKYPQNNQRRQPSEELVADAEARHEKKHGTDSDKMFKVPAPSPNRDIDECQRDYLPEFQKLDRCIQQSKQYGGQPARTGGSTQCNVLQSCKVMKLGHYPGHILDALSAEQGYVQYSQTEKGHPAEAYHRCHNALLQLVQVVQHVEDPSVITRESTQNIDMNELVDQTFFTDAFPLVMHNKSGGEPASGDKALRRQSALSILENAIVFCTEGAQILTNGMGPFLFVINDLVPLLRDHGKLGLLDALASQIFGYPDDPNSGELRHSTAICSGYVPADQVLRTVLSISRAFGHEEAMDRLSGPEGEGLLKIFVRVAAQEGGEAFAATVRRLFEKEEDKSLTRDERALLAHLRKCWTLAGENSAEEWRRLLELEEADELGPADKIKLTEWRVGKSAGGLAGGVSEGLRAKWNHEWNRMYALLRDYKEENGDCLVPYRKGKPSRLYEWVLTQRGQYRLKRDGKRSNLTNEREVLLDKIGFTWRINLSWNDRFQQLENVGSCSGAAILQADSSLYCWCSSQLESRQRWRKREREYQRELSRWKNSRRRGNRPTWRDKAQYEKWIKREELLDQLDFWNQFRST